jgi:hypothetical protein
MDDYRDPENRAHEPERWRDPERPAAPVTGNDKDDVRNLRVTEMRDLGRSGPDSTGSTPSY